MFTGIIEEVGQIVGLEKNGGNLKISIKAKMTPELKIDQRGMSYRGGNKRRDLWRHRHRRNPQKDHFWIPEDW